MSRELADVKAKIVKTEAEIDKAALLIEALEKFEDDAVRDGLEILDAMLRGVIEAR